MSGNLEDEVRAFDVDDSSSGKPFRPSSRSGSRYERRGEEVGVLGEEVLVRGFEFMRVIY